MQATSLFKGKKSQLEKVDVRAKIIISVLSSILTLIMNSPQGQLSLFAFSTIYALSMRRLKLLLISYIFVILMLIIASLFAALIHFILPSAPNVKTDALLVPFLRVLIMINVILPLAFSSRIQSLLTALKSIHLPFVLYIPLAVMIRFIPTFIFDVRQIIEALRIRGYQLNFSQIIRHPLLSLRFITIPLLFRSLKTSEDLGVAAELKGLGAYNAAENFKPYRTLIWQKRDSLLMLIVFLAASLSLACHIFLGTPVSGGHR